jgi:Na+-driven multidrug efflux pump
LTAPGTMKDLTQGSIRGHILRMAAPIAVGMLVQTLYFLVDLYFVSRLGSDALAGVSLAGNAVLLVMALTQVLSVGTRCCAR